MDTALELNRATKRFGQTTAVHEARPLVLITIPPVGIARLPVMGVPFWPVIAQLPLVVMVALTPHMLVVQPEKAGAPIDTETGPLGLVFPGAAGTAPVVLELVQVTVTLPATNFTCPNWSPSHLRPRVRWWWIRLLAPARFRR